MKIAQLRLRGRWLGGRWFRGSGLGIVLLALSAVPMPRLLIWNASASVPKGLYLAVPVTDISRGQLVIATPPQALAQWLDARGYLPLGIPLIKPVAATSAQIVCRHDAIITVDGIVIGTARAADHLGRPLPVWRGCSLVAADQIFLMNRQAPDSLDGRYFGILPRSVVRGRAIPLWTYDGD